MGNEPDGMTAAAGDLDAGRRFARAPDSLWRQLADVVLVRTVADPQIVELSGTGFLLWVALVEPGTAGELASELAAVVSAPMDVVAADVGRGLAELVRRGVVSPLEGT